MVLRKVLVVSDCNFEYPVIQPKISEVWLRPTVFVFAQLYINSLHEYRNKRKARLQQKNFYFSHSVEVIIAQDESYY